MRPSAVPTVACFGEALWDVLPRGIFLGGAPLNVAYHLARHGLRAVPVSAVGQDFLGREIHRRLQSWEIDARFVTTLKGRPTGTVLAELDAHGTATYEIVRDVAWDHIPTGPVLRQLSPPDALVYGSLALRSPVNRRSFEHLVARWPSSLRVLDINLRRPFDRGPGVDLALRHAQLIKLNDEELIRLADASGRDRKSLESAARRLARKCKVGRICVTAGGRGAGLLWDDAWQWSAGRRVQVRDTIGAGDAFLGSFLATLLQNRAAPPQALERACRMGEFVATCDGATPAYRVDRNGRPQRLER